MTREQMQRVSAVVSMIVAVFLTVLAGVMAFTLGDRSMVLALASAAAISWYGIFVPGPKHRRMPTWGRAASVILVLVLVVGAGLSLRADDLLGGALSVLWVMTVVLVVFSAVVIELTLVRQEKAS